METHRQDLTSGSWLDVTSTVALRLPNGWQLRIVELTAAPEPGPALRSVQFKVGRTLASDALSALGASTTDVPRHAKGYPNWPPGFTGSIAHSGALVGVIVAQDSAGKSPMLGLDLEHPARLTAEMWPNVFSASEQQRLHASAAPQQTLAAMTHFCAKEAAYKALYPGHGEVTGFLGTEVHVDLGDPSQVLSVTVGADHRLTGYWFTVREYVGVVCARASPDGIRN